MKGARARNTKEDIMATLAELLKQKDELEKKIEAARNVERESVIEQVVATCNAHGIKFADLKPYMTKQRAKRSTKAAEA